jgi:plasmid stability protein
MKNLTISLDDETHRMSRLAAAAKGMSMSRYVAELLTRDVKTTAEIVEDAERRRRLEALQRVFDAPKLNISENGRMPTAEERNARR